MSSRRQEYYQAHKAEYAARAKQWKLDNPEKAELAIQAAVAKQMAKQQAIRDEVKKRNPPKTIKPATYTQDTARINKAIKLLAEAVQILSEITTKATLENEERTIPVAGTDNKATDSQA